MRAVQFRQLRIGRALPAVPRVEGRRELCFAEGQKRAIDVQEQQGEFLGDSHDRTIAACTAREP